MSRKKNNKDGQVLLKNSFQWLYMVICILFLFVFMFGIIFRVVSFRLRSENGIKNVSVIVSHIGYSFNKGDEVAAFFGSSNFVGEIAAFSGEEITVGTGKNSLVDFVIYDNKRLFSSEELSEVINDTRVPENCVLIREIVPEYGYMRVGEIIEADKIIGRAECIVYPFNMIGKSVVEMNIV